MSIIEHYPSAKGLTLSDMLVPAVMADLKTQTRRMIKPQPEVTEHGNLAGSWTRKHLGGLLLPKVADLVLEAPWKPGDFLYVRETHYRYGHWEKTGEKTRTGKDKWAFIADSDEVRFEVPAGAWRKSRNRAEPHLSTWYKRLARFMPKACSRTVLEVTGVRVERLQDISEADAKAEGIEREPDTAWWKNYDQTLGGWRYWESAVQSFRTLWESIRGQGSWGANPWVWVIEFRRVVNSNG